MPPQANPQDWFGDFGVDEALIQKALSAASAYGADDADLYAAGMTSHASVNVMLALEDAFDLEFPDRMLKRSVFESINAIHDAIQELTA